MDPLRRINDRAERAQEWQVVRQTTILVVKLSSADLYDGVALSWHAD